MIPNVYCFSTHFFTRLWENVCYNYGNVTWGRVLYISLTLCAVVLYLSVMWDNVHTWHICMDNTTTKDHHQPFRWEFVIIAPLVNIIAFLNIIIHHIIGNSHESFSSYTDKTHTTMNINTMVWFSALWCSWSANHAYFLVLFPFSRKNSPTWSDGQSGQWPELNTLRNTTHKLTTWPKAGHRTPGQRPHIEHLAKCRHAAMRLAYFGSKSMIVITRNGSPHTLSPTHLSHVVITDSPTALSSNASAFLGLGNRTGIPSLCFSSRAAALAAERFSFNPANLPSFFQPVFLFLSTTSWFWRSSIARGIGRCLELLHLNHTRLNRTQWHSLWKHHSM